MITLQEFLHSPNLTMSVLEAGYTNPEKWFNTVFPNGAASEYQIMMALKVYEITAKGMKSYSYDKVKEVLVVYNKMGVVNFCKDIYVLSSTQMMTIDQ